MKSKPEMFQRPCLILAGCIASVYLLGFYIASPLSLTPRGARFDFFFVIVFLPQFVLTASALTSNMPPLARAVLALALAFIPSLIYARVLVAIWKRNLFVNDKSRTISVGVMIGLALLAVTAVYFMPIGRPPKPRPDITLPRYACMENVRSLVQISHMYAIEYEGEFPASFQALDAAGYTIGNLTSCPSVRGSADYGLNTAVTKDCPPGTPYIGDFDSTNHAGTIFRRRDRHAGNIGYLDGSVRMYIGEYSAGSGPLENVSAEDWVRE